MRYFLAIVALGGIYTFATHKSPTTPAKTTPQPAAAQPVVQIAPAASPSTNYLKRPLDRTHDVLGQVRKNVGENSF